MADASGRRGHTQIHAHERSPFTAARAASSSTAIWFTSAESTMYGGRSRSTVSAVRLMSSPRSSAASTTGAAGRSSSRPQITPAPRTSTTVEWRAATRRSAASISVPISRHVRHQARGQLVEKHLRRPAREQVAAVGAAVIAERRGVGHALREQRRAHRHAAAERLSGANHVRLQTQLRRVEGHTRAAEAALHFVGDEQRAAARAGRPDRRRHLEAQRADAPFTLQRLGDDRRGLRPSPPPAAPRDPCWRRTSRRRAAG